MAEDPSTHKFLADRPIVSGKADLLGITGFAESLAGAIKGWKGKDSLVIALYGAWGSGKTSIKNVAIESLCKDEKNCPLIVEFNPWHWAGQKQIAEAFFQEIRIVLGKGDSSSDKKRAAKWKYYSTYLKAASFISDSLRKAIFWILMILALAGLSGCLIEIQGVKTIVIVISVVVIIFAALLRWGGSFADHVTSIIESKSAASQEGLPELKKELINLLGDLKSSVLVVIDDVDRLSPEDIKYLFQLVKANADFPNMVYLLLFQRDIVEKSLEADFLEKIVQIGFDIPKIQRTRMGKVLFSGLNDLLSDEKIEKRFDQHRWSNIFVAGLRPFFNTLRDVHRFLSMLSFQISLFRKEESFEVNPIDLIAVEALRTFEPKVYQGLFGIKDILTKQYDSDYGESTENIMSKRVETVINQSSESNRPAVKEILKQLFPHAEYYLGGSRYDSGFAERWYRDLRVCHPNVFDRYFHFTIPEGDISQTDIDSILSSSVDRQKLVSIFHSLNKRGLLDVVLDRLEAYKEHLDLKYAVPFISAIFDVGDELPEMQPGFYITSPDTHASRIVYWYLKQEPDITKRGQLLHEAINATNGVYLPVRQTEWEEYSYAKQEAGNSSLISLEAVNELKKICVDKIRYASKSDVLRTHTHMLSILYHWREWSSSEEPQKWVEALIHNKEGLLSFLGRCLSSSASHSSGDYVERIHWRIRLKDIEDFISPDTIAEKVSSLKIEELTEREQKAVRAFQKAIKRRQEGKSDDDWHYDEE
ncbi:MAG: hypothetical protein HY808_14620 [Nitrospirae bacterium]|nr:hypothetical protein [Nitrospirota bacterium]